MKTNAKTLAHSLFVAMLLCFTPFSAVAFPFVPTQLVDGAFSDTTTWYTMTIDNSALLISNPGSADRINLSGKLQDASDANLWCFVGNNTDGYVIYNKAAGPSVVLSSPNTLTGTTGATAYVVLKTPGASGYQNLWQFSSSSDLDGVDGVYMYQKGKTANKVNNRNGVLAFWTAGQDHGSTLIIEFAKKKIPVNLNTGSFTSSNSAKTYHSVWTYSQSNPSLKFSHSNNNIDLPNSGDNSIWRMSANNSAVYTFLTSSEFIISSVGVTFTNNNSSVDMTISCGSQSASAHDVSTANFVASGLSDPQVQITLSPSGSNAILASDIWAVVERSFKEVEPSVELFQTFSGGIPYRIPAIAVAQNGDVIAISDYRYCRADIGNGRIDLYQRTSHDNGATWDRTNIVAQGDGILNSAGRNASLTAGYGDACIVADRESPRVLLMSVCGYQTFQNASRDVPNQMVRWYSNDNGATWTGPEVITEMFYKPFDENCNRGPIKSMFIGSGKIHQSRYVKVGNYYRLYCSMLARDVNNTYINYVIYSDDFGETWNVLGDVNEPPIPSGADEPKAEELPDGSVVISSRCTGGRYYNIFSFTDLEKAEGSWGTHAFSGSSNNGVTALSNSCNGEILIVPARRNKDNQQVYLALQSVPFGSGRNNVGIYYKELSSYEADFANPATFAANWDGHHQASSLGSAYSTMAVQHDGNIGFLYEESTNGADYTIVYKNYSLETITNSAYSLVSGDDIDAAAISRMLKDELSAKINGLTPGTNVGQLSEDGIATLQAQVAACEGTVEDIAALHKALQESLGVPLEEGHWYRLRNALYPDYYLTPSTSTVNYTGVRLTKTNYAQLFSFERVGSSWRIKAANLENYVGPTQATNTLLSQTSSDECGIFNVIPHPDGRTQFVCQNPVNSIYNTLHLNTNYNLVSWTTSADASSWIVEPADEIQYSVPSTGYASRIFSFAVTLPEGAKAYALSAIEEAEGDTAYAVLAEIPQPVPARTPFVYVGTRGASLFQVCPDVEEYAGTNLLDGNLRAGTVAGNDIYVFRTLAPVGYSKRTNATGNIAANTGYLRYTGAAKFVSVDVNRTTGITPILLNEVNDNVWYDLQGRRVYRPSGGVFINSQGQKVIFK